MKEPYTVSWGSYMPIMLENSCEIGIGGCWSPLNDKRARQKVNKKRNSDKHLPRNLVHASQIRNEFDMSVLGRQSCGLERTKVMLSTQLGAKTRNKRQVLHTLDQAMRRNVYKGQWLTL